MSRISDAEFLREQPEAPATQRPLSVEEKAQLRGIASKATKAQAIRDIHYGDEGVPEYVSYVDTEASIRRHGWLVGQGPNGEARIEVADGAFAYVPMAYVEREADRQNRDVRREAIRDAVGSGSRRIRADLAETRAPIPLGPETARDFSVTLQYQASLGLPSEDEVMSYLAAKYPGARLLDADDRSDGILGLVLHFDSEAQATKIATGGQGDWHETYREPGLSHEEIGGAANVGMLPAGTGAGFGYTDDQNRMAEMQFAEGGEVLEILDPHHDIDDEVHVEKGETHEDNPRAASTSKTAAPTYKERSVTEVAKALLNNVGNRSANVPKLMGDMLATYVSKGGLTNALSSNTPIQPQQLLEDAIRAEAQAKSPLWQKISNFVSSQGAGDQRINIMNPGQHQAPSPFDNAGMPAQSPDGQQYVGPPQRPQTQPAPVGGGSGVPAPLPLQPPAGRGVPQTWQPKASKDFSVPTLQRIAFALPTPRLDDHKRFPEARPAAPTENSRRPTMREIFASMRCDHVYATDNQTICMRIVWDPELFDGVGGAGIRQAVLTFVKGYASQIDRHKDMGWIGKPHFKSFDRVAGRAEIAVESSRANNFPQAVLVLDPLDNDYGAMSRNSSEKK